MAPKHIRVKNSENHSKFESLTGHFMVALPGLKSEDLQETVLLICQHDTTGAMALVINQTISGVHLSDLIDQPSLLRNDFLDFSDQPIFWGGPVTVNQGFVLHSGDISWPSTIAVNENVSITPHLDVLEEALTKDTPLPRFYRAMLGHVAWKSGQLEKEWMQQAWVSLPYQDDFLFETDPEKQWSVLLDSCGIHPMNFSPLHGRV